MPLPGKLKGYTGGADGLYFRVMKPENRRAGVLRPLLLLLFLLLATLPALAQGPYRVDFGAGYLFVRTGWDEKKAGDYPMIGDAGWMVIRLAGRGGMTVRPIDLGLPGIPVRKTFSFDSAPPMDFTYVLPFDLSAEAAAHFRSLTQPGLHFAGLGDNWEVWLNGTKVREEMHLDAEGRITEHRANRDIHFPVEGSLLREGHNVVAVRILADPTFPPNGFHQADPYVLDDYTEIERMNSELWPVLLCGLYLFVGLYHVFMFLVRREDYHNLFYGFFSIVLAIYLFVRTHTVNLFVTDSYTIFRIELFALFILLPLIGAFLETLRETRVGKITIAYAILCVVLAFVELFAPVAFSHDILRAWQVTGLVMAFYYFGYEILGHFLGDGFRRWKRTRGQPGARGLLGGYLRDLAVTPLGNLLIGGFILFGTAVFDIIDSLFMQWDLVLTQYGFFVFTMGTAFVLANRLGFLQDRLSSLNQDLEERIRVLTETGARLSASEHRYRSLFEGTSEAVALLDEELRFIEGNGAANRIFGLDRPGREDYRLYEAVYAEEREGDLPLEILRQAAGREEGGEPRELSLRIKTDLGEPRPLRLTLERIDDLGHREILLRAAPEGRDSLAGAFVEARERYDIESSLQAADEVCRRASAGLARYLPEADAGFLAICLREIVVNAVEHGNLEISFEEKTASQRDGTYHELLRRRRLHPAYRQRRIAVEYSISAVRATFRVTDEGKGFDTSAWVKAEEIDAGLLEHGRGIFMTRSGFDQVVYSDLGNQVTLVKWFQKPAGETGA